MRVQLTFLLALTLAACGETPCEEACSNQVDCGELDEDELTACSKDCEEEPWPDNYVECRATTCGQSEAQCERFGQPQATCHDACSKEASCGEIDSSEVDACVTDCETEPWDANYIECRAATCGRSDAECETWPG